MPLGKYAYLPLCPSLGTAKCLLVLRFGNCECNCLGDEVQDMLPQHVASLHIECVKQKKEGLSNLLLPLFPETRK